MKRDMKYASPASKAAGAAGIAGAAGAEAKTTTERSLEKQIVMDGDCLLCKTFAMP